MSGETELLNVPPAPQPDLFSNESLTDVIDELKRAAFRRSLDRRPPDSNRRTIDTSQLVRVKSS